MGWPTPKCGTDGGYQRHIRLKEDPCEDCLAAHNDTINRNRWARGVKPRGQGPEHGSRAAYVRERRAWRAGKGPEPCQECRAANAAARRRS